MTEKRQMVQIPAEQVKKLNEIEATRSDLKGYTVSKKVHLLLQEKLKVAVPFLKEARNQEKRAIDALIELLSQAKDEEKKASEFLDVEFSNYLNKELDKAFNF